MKIGIVGSGIAAIATSIRLVNKGNSVVIIESNDKPGGKLTSFKSGDYFFDAGPSLFTMPTLINEIYNEVEIDMRKYFQYQQLDKTCHYFYEDGTIIHGKTDLHQYAQEIKDKLNVPKQKVIDYLNHSKQIYELTSYLFLQKSLHKPRTYFDKRIFRTLFNIQKLNLNKTMNEVNQKKLQHPKLVQLFNRFATYNGSNPYQAPAVLNIIPHLEHNQGTYFPKGGMRAITNSLYQLSIDLGVTYKFNETVDQILIKDKKVIGLKTQKQDYQFDRIVSNMDIYPTYKKLLSNHKPPHKILNQPRSSSALIFYWGIKKEFKQLDLHNIFFTEDYHQEFKSIFEEKTIYHDPTIYINISSKYNKTDAPKGCENWFVMINVPNNIGQNWDELIKKSKKNILQKLTRMLKQPIEKLIETEEILDPRKIESKTSSYQGALYGASSNNKMAAFLRHKNFSSKIKGLYFVGGSVHPGGGIPLCLLSSKIGNENFK